MLKIVEPSFVRWLSHDAAVHAFLVSLPAVILELEKEAEFRKDLAAKAYAKKIKTYRFIASLSMLADVLPHLSTLSEQFQKREIDFGLIEPSLETAKKSLRQLKLEPGPNEKKVEDLLLKLREVITFGVSTADRERFQKNIRLPYLESLLTRLDERFLELPLISSLRVLVPSRFPKSSTQLAVYGNEDISYILDHLGKQQEVSEDLGQRHSLFLDPVATHQEWTHLKSLVATQIHLRNCGSVQSFVQQLHKHHGESLPNILLLANWALSIPFATADCERDLSRLKLIKTDLRSCLKNETLCNLMTISIDGPPVSEFPFPKALCFWHFWRSASGTAERPCGLTKVAVQFFFICPTHELHLLKPCQVNCFDHRK